MFRPSFSNRIAPSRLRVRRLYETVCWVTSRRGGGLARGGGGGSRGSGRGAVGVRPAVPADLRARDRRGDAPAEAHARRLGGREDLVLRAHRRHGDAEEV